MSDEIDPPPELETDFGWIIDHLISLGKRAKISDEKIARLLFNSSVELREGPAVEWAREVLTEAGWRPPAGQY